MIRRVSPRFWPEVKSPDGRSLPSRNTRPMDIAEDTASEQLRGVAEERSARLTFALVSPCGYGNLGDAAIQDAMIANIRRRFPDARIRGITLNPADTVQRHGIPAFPLSGNSSTGYCGPSSSGQSVPKNKGRSEARASVRRRFARALAWGPKRIARLLLPRGWPELIKKESIHIARSFDSLRDVDFLIFSGGGQLDDYWGVHGDIPMRS